MVSINTTAGDNCPSPWIKDSFNNVTFCLGSTEAGCYSVNYSTNGTSYHRVCGKASGYQKGTPDGFRSPVVDGLSITYGSPRQHLWTYAVGFSDSDNFANVNCPCNSRFAGRNPPAFVGSDYYCESGRTVHMEYYLTDVLWDGEGCIAGNMCCSDPNLPWFYRQLNGTTQDDIEVRSCMDGDFNDEALLITSVELYVQ